MKNNIIILGALLTGIYYLYTCFVHLLHKHIIYNIKNTNYIIDKIYVSKNECYKISLKETLFDFYFYNKFYVIKKCNKNNYSNEINILKKYIFNNKYLIGNYINNNNYYLIFNFLGKDLYYYIENKMLSHPQIKQICKNIIKELQKIHNVGIIHSDLKPENIVLLSNNKIQIIDYGNSHIINYNYEYKLSGYITKYFSSPELCKGIYTEKADIWSIGVIIYTLYEGNYIDTYIDTWINDIYDSNNIPDNIKDILIKMLDYNYKKRPSLNIILTYFT